MATLEATYSTTIKESESDSCFGIPGWGLPAAMLNVEMDLSVLVYSDRTCKLKISYASFYAGNIYGTTFPCEFYYCPKQFTFKYKNHYVSTSTSDAQLFYSQIYTRSYYYGWFNWTFKNKTKDLGSIYNLNATEDGKDGYIYIGGVSNDYVTNPIYPTPVKIIIPGLGAEILKTDYYPYAVYSDGWQSCNRDGGSFKAYGSSAWEDRKNTEDDTSNSTCFYYSGGWEIQPKVGSE